MASVLRGYRAVVRLRGVCAGGADRLCPQEAYESVVEYFGENPKTTSPSTFFSLFSRFIKAYKVCVFGGQAGTPAGHCSLSTWAVGVVGVISAGGLDREGRTPLTQTCLGPSESRAGGGTVEESSSYPGGGQRHPGKRGAPRTQGRQLPLRLVLGSNDAWYPHPKDLALLHTLIFMD